MYVSHYQMMGFVKYLKLAKGTTYIIHTIMYCDVCNAARKIKLSV